MTHPGSEIKLILLDFDGTLADTRRANTLAYVATLREAGYTLTEEEYAARYFGMRCDEFLTRIGIADPAERERLPDRKPSGVSKRRTKTRHAKERDCRRKTRWTGFFRAPTSRAANPPRTVFWKPCAARAARRARP